MKSLLIHSRLSFKSRHGEYAYTGDTILMEKAIPFLVIDVTKTSATLRALHKDNSTMWEETRVFHGWNDNWIILK